MHRLFHLIITVLLLAGCAGENNHPADAGSIQVTDAKGNIISLKKPAEKIVALFDPAVDALYMLQMQHTLMGIPAETYADPELHDLYKLIDNRIASRKLPAPGSNETANLEAIIQLKPDLVIVQHMTNGAINSLREWHIPVYQAAANKYEDVIKELQDLGKLTGNEQRAAELIQFADSTIQSMQEQSQALREKKKVYFAWANGRIFSTAGRSSMMHNTLENAGVENVCTTSIDQPNINPETLMQWNPDMIIMWNDSPDLFYDKIELQGINAIQQRQIHNLMPMFFFNPHTLKSLTASVAIHHRAYGENEKVYKEKLDAIIKKLYGDSTGTKLLNLLK